MSADPTTPVRVPKAAGTYTPSTQDPDLRSEINGVLLKDGHVHNPRIYLQRSFSLQPNRIFLTGYQRIQETLVHALNASSTNWPTLIQEHALSLLRNGDCTSFPELMRQVITDIKHDTDAHRKQDPNLKQTNGSAVNGKGSGEHGANLALPRNVVEEGVRITREALDTVVYMDGMEG
ncbi:hypothetical protein D0Z07_4843 [Hyphodiscus hymeniophilus]|uniref:Uncharacterized protein n=1 Tax=Hyphodiscus hymeniophilus TaxID=353542 RepID=A0A9P6VJ83_9HELO|nr:hypothetical protein D0Z07_4843 [Hyphodiscus hymeniophilus]